MNNPRHLGGDGDGCLAPQILVLAVFGDSVIERVFGVVLEYLLRVSKLDRRSKIVFDRGIRRMPAPKGARPPAAGRGRPKGSPNKLSGAVKDMVIQALDQAGGVEYLTSQAEKNPAAFMALLGKVLPIQVAGADDGPLVIQWVNYAATESGEPAEWAK